MSKIKVTPAEEDEVIVAGAPVEAEPAPEPEPVPEAVSEPVLAPEPEPEPEPIQAKEPAKKKAEEYHETTLEDLETGDMPLAQRIVIIAAIVCIIGALVYYFVAMR